MRIIEHQALPTVLKMTFPSELIITQFLSGYLEETKYVFSKIESKGEIIHPAIHPFLCKWILFLDGMRPMESNILKPHDFNLSKGHLQPLNTVCSSCSKVPGFLIFNETKKYILSLHSQCSKCMRKLMKQLLQNL